MDVLILCKDCGEQFGNNKSNETMNKILKLSSSSPNISLQLSECMDVCPTGKICTISLLENQINSMKKVSLLPDEICRIISKK